MGVCIAEEFFFFCIGQTQKMANNDTNNFYTIQPDKHYFVQIAEDKHKHCIKWWNRRINFVIVNYHFSGKHRRTDNQILDTLYCKSLFDSFGSVLLRAFDHEAFTWRIYQIKKVRRKEGTILLLFSRKLKHMFEF